MREVVQLALMKLNRLGVFVLRIFCILWLVIGSTSVAFGDERVGSFVLVDGRPDVILLDGKIEIGTPLDFRRALQAFPKAQTLVLNSPGGLVASALILADDVRRAELGTIIPAGMGCYSACAFVYFSGVDRKIDGELGVHQMWAEQPDPGTLQITLSDVVDAFEKFDVPSSVLSRMLRTDSTQMYVYSADEVTELALSSKESGLDRFSVGEEVLAAARWHPGEAPQIEEDVPSAQPASLQLAVYGGIDFFGNDIGQGREEDVAECAAVCLGSPQCQAFTFNANPRIRTGPNCFLKSGVDRLETYGDALSGLFLDVSRGDVPTYSVGGIDPTNDVLSGSALAGTTLSQTVVSNGATCRMSCIDDELCSGYSFAPPRDQCTLFSRVDRSYPAGSVISGIKRWQTFEPISVISLDE